MSKVICFHKPKEAYGFLSNWYLSEFTAEGRRFTSMEQYMMYKKAQTFRDQEAAEKILEISDVSRIKQLGRQVRNYVGGPAAADCVQRASGKIWAE